MVHHFQAGDSPQETEEVRVTKAADGRMRPGLRGIRYDHKVGATQTGLE